MNATLSRPADAELEHSNASRPAVRWTMAALVLVVLGIAVRQLAVFDHDVPPRVQLARDAEAILPIVSGKSSVAQTVGRYHDAGERLWKFGWVALNGQLDHRLSSLGTIAWQSLALAALLAALAQAVRLRWVLVIGASVGLVALAPALGNVPPPMGSAGASGAIFLSLLHGILLARARSNSAWWWLGVFIGVLNVLWATAGIAASIALATWSAFGRRRTVFAASAAVAVLGVGLAVMRGVVVDAMAFRAIVMWPFTGLGWAILGWAPVLLWLARWTRGGRAADRNVLALLAGWAMLLPAALALTGVRVEAAGEFLLVILACHAAALISLRPGTATGWPRYLLLAGGWIVLVADAVIHRPPPLHDETAANAMLGRAEMCAVLPMALRAPLPVQPAAPAARGGFVQGGAPQLPAHGDLPVIGSWTPAGGAAVGEFVSTPLRSTFPYVQLRVAGALQPPATSLVLRGSDGVEVAPLESGFTATDRWKRVNFRTPASPFQIVARDTSATAWLAFTAPIEVGRGTRVAGKLPSTWPLMLVAGLLCGAAALTMVRLHAPVAATAHGVELAALWRVAPWLGLFAYGLFFSHHVDPTAGPNDSGGYLNSAKLLVGGSVAAAPRMPAGVELDRDPTLYTPITFHVKGDRLVPEYPVGFPLEVWAMALLMPFDRAVYFSILLQLVLGVIFTERLGRAFGLERGWAWFGAAVIGLSPVYLFQALQPQSDGPATVWVTAAVYWAWTSREQPARALLAGLATALAVLLRPSNALCVLPVLACVVGPRWPRRLLYLGLAGLPGALWLMWYQHTLYGSWHTTGYGNVSTSFGLRFIAPTLRSYATWLPEMFTPLVVLACGAPFLRSVSRHARLVLVLWTALLIAFYAVYWCTWDNWYNMRFVLPAAPAMVVMALLVARELLAWLALRFPRFRRLTLQPVAAVLAAAALLGFLAARSAARDVLYWLHNNHEHEYAAKWVGEHLPANAVVFAKHATGSLMHYTDLPFIRSDHDKARESTVLYDQLERAGRPIYALNYHWETAGYTWQGGRGSGYPDLPGKWDRVALMWDNDVMVWKRQPSPAPPASGK